MYGEDLTFQTPGKGLHEITQPLAEAIRRADVETGLCHVFLRHTSASLVITENADPSARRDLLSWFDRLAPENDPDYTHTSEGPDDMPSHLKAAVTRTSETLPVKDGRLDLGTWQGVFIFEPRTRPPGRTISVRVWD
mgnify:CR=1 FL=1